MDNSLEEAKPLSLLDTLTLKNPDSSRKLGNKSEGKLSGFVA